MVGVPLLILYVSLRTMLRRRRGRPPFVVGADLRPGLGEGRLGVAVVWAGAAVIATETPPDAQRHGHHKVGGNGSADNQLGPGETPPPSWPAAQSSRHTCNRSTVNR